MQINILLPHKEKFDRNSPSSVSITVRNNLFKSKFKNKIKVYGKKVKHPIIRENFVGIEDPPFFKSKNKNLASQMCEEILKSKHANHIIEIHNRPYLFNLIYSKLKGYKICIFFHNDPLVMKGSKTINERINLIKKSKMIYCVSEYIKKKFLEGIDDNFINIKVLHNGVDRKLSKFPKKINEVIFVGRLVPEKGVHLFIDSIKKISGNFPTWKFSIIGSSYLGSYEKETDFAKKQSLRFVNIGKQTKFTGFLNPDEVQKKMKEASIIVVPSIWNEPYGLVVAEAMANGIAIIASDVGGISEITKDNAILIQNINSKKITDKLEYIMSKKKNILKYQKLSWNNFKHSSELSSLKLDNFRIKIFQSTI